MSKDKEIGLLEGDDCNREGCLGVIESYPLRGCTCHINPPCHACTTPREYCPACSWEAEDEPLAIKEESTIAFDLSNGLSQVAYKRRVLDPSKIDYHTKMHTTSSQKVIGVYPLDATKDDVFKEVSGTFGGRFTKFADGHFEFIAYTD